MIVPMKKISVFMKDVEKVTALRRLRKMGVMHINATRVKSERIDELNRHRDDFRKICDRIGETYDEALKKSQHRVEEVIRFEEALHKRKRLLESIADEHELTLKVIETEAEIERISSWGDFSPEDLKALSEHGIELTLYTVKNSVLEESDDFEFIRLHEGKHASSIAVLGRKLPTNPEFHQFQLPRKSLSELRTSIEFYQQGIKQIHGLFIDEARYLICYRDIIRRIDEELIFESAHYSMDGNGDIAWITGFMPEERQQDLMELARKESWGLLIDDVKEGDQVPTQLKNNRVVRMIEPIFDILGIVPGYREYDLSLFFLLFFSVFFAMIIGDAGYGLIFLSGAVGLHIATRKMTEPLKLIYVLSTTTVIWGAVTGTWFGSDALLESVPLLKRLVIPTIATFPELFEVTSKEAQMSVIFISFVLGIVQLSIACIINFFRELPELKSLAQLGWMLMLIGLYFLVLNLVIGIDFPAFAQYLIVIGLAVFVLFSQQEKGKSVIKGMLSGLAGLFNTFLDAISGFSNIISYIRLFAVGMASVAIASSFNEMAAPMLGGWTIPAAILILVFGHGLNLIMGLLSVVVHGIRLNMLEFSGQLGMEWTGIKYEPFKETIDSSLEETSN